MRHRIESHMTSVNQMARKDGMHLVNNIPFRPRPEAGGRVISDEITESQVLSFDGAVGFTLVEPDEPYATVKAMDPAVPLHLTAGNVPGAAPRTQRLEADLSGLFGDDEDEPDGSAAVQPDAPVSEPETPPLPVEGDEHPLATLVAALDLTEAGNERTVAELREHMNGMTVKELRALAADLTIDLDGARAKADIIDRIVTAP